MERQEKHSGHKKRSKQIQVGLDSGDDEPIGSLFGLKSKRNPKKVKKELDGVGEKGKGVEAMAENLAVGNEDLGGMDDTLATFRKKLKGPKKESVSSIAVERSLGGDATNLSGQSLDRHVKDESFTMENKVVETGQMVVEDGSVVAIGEGLCRRGNKKVKRSRKASNPKRAVRRDAMGSQGCGDISIHNQKECVLAGREGSNPSLDDNVDDSLSAFFKKAGSSKKSFCYLRQKQRRKTEVAKTALSSDDGSEDFLPLVTRGSQSVSLVQKCPQGDESLHLPSDRLPIILADYHQNKNGTQETTAENVQENPLPSNAVEEVSSTLITPDVKMGPGDNIHGGYPESVADACFPNPLLRTSQPFLSACACKTARVEEDDTNGQTCATKEGPQLEPRGLDVKDDCSLPSQETISKTPTMNDGLNTIGLAPDSANAPTSLSFPVQVQDIHQVDVHVSNAGFNGTMDEQPKSPSAVIPFNVDLKICTSSGKEGQEACFGDDSLNISCKNSSQETFNPALDTSKKEGISSDCNDLNQAPGICIEEPVPTSVSSQKEDTVISNCRLPPQAAHGVQESEHTIQMEHWGKSVETGDGMPKETSLANNDYLSGSGEATGASSPAITPERAEGYAEGQGHLSDPEFKDKKLSSLQRTLRRSKKRRHGDMAYEGDADWEVLLHDQDFLESRLIGDGDRSLRGREKFSSSPNMAAEAENGRAAAVSAGLKAHAVGPLERIKFKEVLKRKGGLQEYLQCRNHILNLWSKDVSRVLPLTECGVSTGPSIGGPPRASLVREIYAFLDRSGYINFGVASEKAGTEPSAVHNFRVLKEKNNGEKAGATDADAYDGVSFILGQIRTSEACMGTKNSNTDSQSQEAETSKDGKLVTPHTVDLDSSTKSDECRANELHKNDSVDTQLPNRTVSLEVLGSSPCCKALGSGAVPVISPEPVKHSFGVQSTSRDCMEENHGLQCGSEGKKSIIVIGAGPAGLTAARHLQRQGFSVIVLEARSRIGGRVFTDHSSLSVPVDLGASIITGVEADAATERRPDPSSLICAQLGLELTVLNSDCPLYDIITGQKVPESMDNNLEAEYNSLLDDMLLVVAQKGEQAMKMSLEDGLEYALKRRRMAQLARDHAEIELHNYSDVLAGSEKADAHGKVSGRRISKGDILSPLERRIMNWHFAHLEYGCAALLKDVSLPYWNQDDVYGGFGGAHCMIKGGYSTVVESLGGGLCIHLDHVVTDISYCTKECRENDELGNKVKICTSNGREFSGDAVLITVPLGCLKAETIKFSPPLPQWKNLSIQRLGFGVVNKVVLEFPEVFWDDSVDYFGATAEETNQRGKCFMFWNVKKTVGAPVLIALIVGKAAIEGQNMSSSDHVNHAVTVLRKLFGGSAVPDPVASVVTNWGKDPFSCGAYSYVALGASGEDYDILGRPVENCLFFAGEATCKEHPDTVGGAMMSGLREAVRIIDILSTGNDYIAEVEATGAAQRHTDSERIEVRDIMKRLEAIELSNVLYKNSLDGSEICTKKSLLREMFSNAKTTAGRLLLAKELLNLPGRVLKSFVGTKEGLTTLNSWILDSMGKDGTQLLRHCVRLLVLVSTDLLAVRLSGIGKTVKEKVCVHTSRDIRAIASQLVNMWIDVFRKEKASNGGLRLLRQATAIDTLRRKSQPSGKPPLRVHHGPPDNKGNSQISTSSGSQMARASNIKRTNVKLETSRDSELEIKSSRSQGSVGREDAKVEDDSNFVMSEETQAVFAAAEAAHAAAVAAAEAYASSEAKCNTQKPLPKILSFHKFARREQYSQVDESDTRRKWSGGALGRQDCISEIDSRNCRVRDWSVDFSAACVNLDNSVMPVDSLSQRSHSNEIACRSNFKEHSAESAAVDNNIFTKAWVDADGSIGVKDSTAIDRWQSQAAAAQSEYFHGTMHIRDEHDSNMNTRQPSLKHEKLANEGSVSQVTVNKELTANQPRGVDRIKQAVVDYVATLLMPLYKAKKLDKEGYKSIMKKTATKVMEQTTDAEKAMAVYEFLDSKRKNKIRAFVDRLIERYMEMKPVVKS
ncbi:lysine-specific histone demethylase 1 homolog 3 [Diospyros lotus]|uniref:lysine-specific histone demethylase 1 homolog 3 n=1 Tax=Diospyros lotus TaxID=55363 RepID=UPI00224F6E8A|nr:lysine-specific histone demethylase 1 homolog 3 [Diospyros lotus]XP_052201600.1 lysine-specific histone demethylase 1 homolog 3 [Diospyros lotus]XP_052201601.1 lysine-specific histone demethylase 1 homolog 3 [Diospyros lotus]XP_052201603.1 lysine-specific histone demethylase 1 homolog 3 [Diospyros lotus]XP_052201604.1 lysine-specific histone demethylase 1 homolog 3 [Diospyros lotus]XP_052201605.1 lysine-specific histone demethylase 1 homolog 3 [Diospyros lotus]XP_052201606.1 lysine-specifi